MTMRLDIVTNDAGELVRREHARELGAGVVVAIYRLVKLAQMHDLGNDAFLRQLDQTHQMIGEYCLRSGSNVSVLFADKATFVAGQLLKGNRGAYQAAAELGALLEKIGGSELHISRDLTREDCLAFSEAISQFHRTGSASGLRMPPKIHLRRVADAARLRGIELENLTPDQRIVRAYASAVVIMRRFFEDLSASRYVLPRRIKRIAQSLVDLSDASTASYLGVTEVRNANYDEAGRAVNTAILAVSIARETTQDRAVLCQIALAAMMHDVARPRALALAGAGGAPMPGMAGPSTLSEDQEDRLAAGAAAVLTALGRVNEPSITRTVLTFEALWLRRRTWLGPVYWGARSPTMHATIVAIARRYNDLLTPEPGLPPPTTDFAVATLANELSDPQDRTVLRMLVSALGLLPTGTVVQLSTGEIAEVVRGARGGGDKPRVKIVADANGTAFPQPLEVELAQDPRRTVHRVLSVDGWRKGLEQGPQAPGPGPDEDVVVSDPPPAPASAIPQSAIPQSAAPAPISSLSPNVAWGGRGAEHEAANSSANRNSTNPYANRHAARDERDEAIESGAAGEQDSSASLPSLGSSPSAVGEAMGRMINDSLAPPAMSPREIERPDRTVFQRQDPNDAPVRHIAAVPSGEPTARGNLAATPLPHVLVYMLDHSLTGSVVFEATNPRPDSQNDTIYFVSGVPAKIRLIETVALLGEVLVQDGSVDARTVEQAVNGALHMGILLGEYLVGHDLVSREALAWALEGQLLRKIGHVANLAPEVQYSYYRDVDLLEGWGGEIGVGHPLNPILAAVRHWNDRARVRATLNRIGKHPLTLHPEADLTNLALIAEEQTVLDAIRSESMPLAQLFDLKLTDEEVVSSLIYTLAVTRQFAFKGQKKGPMAARAALSRNMSSSGAASSSVGASSGPRSVMPMPVTTGRPAAPTGMAPAGAPPPSESSRSQGTSSRAESPSAQTRAPAPAAAASSPSGRSLTPARPQGGAPKGGPQIRPIVARKPTFPGAQPAAAGSDMRPAPTSLRQPPAMQPRSDRSEAAAPVDVVQPAGRPSSPPDDAKTIAVISPARKDLLAKRPIAPAAGARPAGVPLPSTAKPTTTNPSPAGPAVRAKPTGPGGAAGQNVPQGLKPNVPNAPNVTGAKAPPLAAKAAGPHHAPTRPALSPVRPTATAGAKGGFPNAPVSSNGGASGRLATEGGPESSSKEMEIELADEPKNRSIEIGEAGLADAEAALEAMTSFRLAEEALQRNDISVAEEYANKAVVGDPTQPDYVVLLAWIRALRGLPRAIDEAIRTMSRVLIEDPSNESALFYRGKLLVRTNRLPEALNDFSELLSANPDHREAQNEARQLKAKMPL